MTIHARQQHRPHGALVIWDVDGTLTRADTLLPFLFRVVGPARWPGVLARSLVETVVHGGSRAQLKSSLLQHCLAGREESDVRSIAADFAAQIMFHRCRIDALTRWSWHRARGDRLVLASASLGLYLEPLGQLLGTEEVLATSLEITSGRFTGALAQPNCRGHEKARRIAELIGTVAPTEVWFYTDSRSDQPGLELADVPITVRPWRRIPALVDTSMSTIPHHSTPGGKP